MRRCQLAAKKKQKTLLLQTTATQALSLRNLTLVAEKQNKYLVGFIPPAFTPQSINSVLTCARARTHTHSKCSIIVIEMLVHNLTSLR